MSRVLVVLSLVVLAAWQSWSMAEETVTIDRTFVPEICESIPKHGDQVQIQYVGKIHESSKTGKPNSVFDRSKKPFSFVLGSSGVIPGFNKGVEGMCLSEKRSVVIPPSLGYGERGTGPIPGGATLQFDLELVSFNAPQEKKTRPNIFREMDVDKDGRITYQEMEHWFQHVHPDHLANIPMGVWERDDKNMDGHISWDEFSGPKGLRQDL